MNTNNVQVSGAVPSSLTVFSPGDAALRGGIPALIFFLPALSLRRKNVLVKSVLSRQLDDLEPTLTRHG